MSYDFTLAFVISQNIAGFDCGQGKTIVDTDPTNICGMRHIMATISISGAEYGRRRPSESFYWDSLLLVK